MSFSSSVSASNRSLACSMRNGKKNQIKLEFPMTLDWYEERSCTRFQSLQHRKERTGFRHEFLVLEFIDGSICRIERMGDPNALLDALGSDGCSACDLAQFFCKEDVKDMHLETSDVVSDISFQETFDLKIILCICRAIHETGKTHNYSLRSFNCYFFALAIQSCLTRCLAGWENPPVVAPELAEILRTTPETLQIQLQLSEQELTPFMLLRVVSQTHEWCMDEILQEFTATMRKLLLDDDLKRRAGDVVYLELWHTQLNSALVSLLEDIIKESWVLTLSHQVKSFVSMCHGKEVESRGNAVICWLNMLLEDLRLPSQVSPKRIPVLLNEPGFSSKGNPQMGCHPPGSRPDTDLLPHIKQLTPTQWRMIIWENLQNLLLFHLSMIYTVLGRCGLIVTKGPGQHMVEMELEQIVLDRMSGDDLDGSNLDAHIRVLFKRYKEGSAIWHDIPWANTCKMLEESLYNSKLKGRLTSHDTDSTVNCNGKKFTVSAFQGYITGRIELQAKLVEWAYLGSATKVQAELKQKMAEIWKIIRDDVRALPPIPTSFVAPSLPPGSGPLLADSQQQAQLHLVLASNSTDTIAPSALDSSSSSSSPPVTPSTKVQAPPDARPPGRWAPWIPDSRQHSTDSLANWEAKVKAKVDWHESSYRLSNNEIVHRVVPYLTCIKCHALPSPNRDAYPLAFDFQGLEHMSITCESLTQQWANKHPAYELVGYWPNVGLEAGRQIVSILVCYRLNYLPITDCFGEGRSLKAARTQAAEKLLRSGHCMIRLA